MQMHLNHRGTEKSGEIQMHLNRQDARNAKRKNLNRRGAEGAEKDREKTCH